MRANRIPGKAKRTIGTMVIDYDNIPFEAENDFEEALLHYLASISNTLVDIEAATSGELDNAVVQQLCKMELSLSCRLNKILVELRRMNLKQGEAA